MFTFLKWSLSLSFSAVDNAPVPLWSPDSAVGTTVQEASEKNLPVKLDSLDRFTVSISAGFGLPHPVCALLFCILPGLYCPHFHLPYASFTCLVSVRNTHCSQDTLLPQLLIFLWIGIDHSRALRGCLARPASSPRVLCPGRLPPRQPLYQFLEQAEACFHEVQGDNVAACLPHITWGLACYQLTITAAFIIRLLLFCWSFVLYSWAAYKAEHLFCGLVQHIHA